MWLSLLIDFLILCVTILTAYEVKFMEVSRDMLQLPFYVNNFLVTSFGDISMEKLIFLELF
jgi:hypothetical protein